MSTRVAYLGPKGTYAEKAAKALAALETLESPEFLPCKGLRSVVENLGERAVVVFNCCSPSLEENAAVPGH